MAIDPDTTKVIGLVGREHHDTRRPMQIRVLGPLEASIDDQPVPIGGAKQRAVLAMLGLEANRAVAADRLIEGLWGDEPPASAAKMVQNYVWRLRGVLAGDGGAEIVTRGRAYELRIDRELVDVCRLERLVSEASREAAAGRPASAAREALALFRGDPLADVADEPFAGQEIRRLEELRLTAAELAIDADLAAGRHHELVGEIEALLAENPLRERLHAQRMLALYRCGRQAEALEAFRDARTTLVEEIGVEPSAELRHLHEAILNQDPSLDVEVAAAELTPELDATASPPLIGRDQVLSRLRARWRRAAIGSGALVTIIGTYGMGKTRLASEIAGEAHREGATVLYASGTGAPETALAVLARARETRRRALIVVDDADRASAEVRAALRELVPALDGVPVLVLATGLQAAALARLEPRESVVLEPLDAGSVRAIAGFYAPGGDDGAIPVDTLLATSGGVARRVHEAASEWARREATRRVDAVADRTAAGRSETRALEAELAGSVVELQAARERAGLVARDGDDERAPLVCPYKGLATFEADDAEYFFGRERLVAELVARLVGGPLLAIVGPSGSGKSSVMRAGLLPALAGGVLPGSEKWTQALIRPGEHPLRELRRVTRVLSRGWHALLAVDQFEEVFTACQDEAERAEFTDSLVRASQAGTVVVLAVRADFYGRCAAYPTLSKLLGANNVLVGPMSREELARAIERPAQRAGLIVEPELVESLLGDVEGRPGALPLLSTALLELWRERDGRRLRLAAYARSGGVHGAVARLAEEAYVGLDPERRAIARQLLVRLADEDESGAVVRRRISLTEFGGEQTEVVERLAERRLLTVSDGAAEVAHEALLREWPRLRGWLDEDAEGRRLHRHLIDAARAWDGGGRDAGDLYRGARLAAALEWRGGHEQELNPTEQAFLDVSRAAAERAQRRLRLVLAAVAALFAVALAGGLIAVHQRSAARTEAQAAEAQRIGAQALTEPDLDRSLLLARQGVAIDDSPATRSNLLAAALRAPAAIAQVRGTGNPLFALDVNAGGRLLAVGDSRGSVLFLDAATRRRIGPAVRAGTAIIAVRFSPDGTRVAVAGYDANLEGFVELLDGRTHRSLGQLDMGFDTGTTEEAVFDVGAVDFSPDSRVLVADFLAAGRQSPKRRYVARWDARTGRRLGPPVPITAGAERGPAIAGFTVSGTRMVTSSAAHRSTVIRDATTLRPVRRLADGGSPAAVSPDGRVAALARPDGSVRLLDLRSGVIRELAGPHEAAVRAMSFTPDSRTLLTAGGDTPVIVWDVSRGAAVDSFRAHAGRVSQLAIARDGRTAYSAGDDGSVIAWDLAGTRRLGRPFGVEPRPASPVVAVTSDAHAFAVAVRGHDVDILDTRTLGRVRRIRISPVAPGSGTKMLVAVTPDGRTMAAATGASVQFVDLRSGRRLGPPEQASAGAVQALEFSADGRWLATSGDDQAIYVWDVRRRRTVGLYLGATGPTLTPATSLSVSPDGKLAATVVHADGSGELQIFSMPRAVLLKTVPVPPGMQTQFSRDGRVLFYGEETGRIWTYDTSTWKPRGRPLAGHDRPGRFALSPDDTMLATTSGDGTTQLWDVASGRPIGTALPGVAGVPVSAAFVDDGRALVTLHDSGRGYVWNIQPQAWAQRACTIAGRILTPAEWHDALPERDYAPACVRG